MSGAHVGYRTAVRRSRSGAFGCNLGNEVERFGVQGGVGSRQYLAAVARRAAVPTRDDTAGILDDRDQGNDVVGLEAGFDNDVDETGGQQRVTPAIGPEPAGADAR